MKNKNSFRKYFISYFLIFIVPIIIITVIFTSYTIISLKTEIELSQGSSLQYNKLLSEHILKSTSAIAQTIAFSNELSYMALQLNSIESSKSNITNATKKLVSLLQVQEAMNQEIHSIYVYIKNNNIVYTSFREIYAFDSFYDRLWMQDNLNTNHRSWSTTRKLYRYQIDSKSSPTNCISYSFIIDGFPYGLDGSVIINMKEDFLFDTLNNEEFDTTLYLIKDSNSNFISHPDKNYINFEVNDINLLHAYNYYLKFNKISRLNDLFVLESESLTNGWTYISISDFNLTRSKIKTNIILLILLIALLIIAGIPICYLISMKTYNPIKKLFDEITKEKKIDIEDGRRDEFSIISSVFKSLNNEYSQLEFNVMKNRINVQMKLVANLLMGIVDEKTCSSELVKSFRYNSYVSIIMLIKQIKKNINTNQRKDIRYIEQVLIKMCEIALNKEAICYGTQVVNSSVVLLINLNDTTKTLKDLEVVFAAVKCEAHKLFDINITIAFGDTCYSIDAIKSSYRHAIQALKWRIVSNGDKVMYYNNIKGLKCNQFHYPKVIENKIFNYVKTRNMNMLLETLIVFIDNVSSQNISIDSLIYIYYQLIGNIIKYIIERQINISKLHGIDSVENLYLQFSQLDSAEEIKNWLYEKFEIISMYSTNSIKNSDFIYIQIMDYIKHNFEKDIYPENVASEIGISYSYLRKLLFEKLGMSFSDYVNFLRIEKSKLLLGRGDLNMNEIAETVGFSNRQSYNRYFKKFEGITAGKYKMKID